MNETKNKILRAASELFLEGGIAALSVRAISKKAGMSTIGIYSHFQGKQGILDSLYIEGFEMVSQGMDVLDEKTSGKQAIMQATHNYLELAESHEAHYRLIFGETDSDYSPGDKARTAGAKAFYRLTIVVSTLLPTSLTLEQKQEAAMQIWSVIHGYVNLTHHPVNELVDMSNWKKRAIDAVELMVDAIATKM